jgi:HK97 gp10 family phage protein
MGVDMKGFLELTDDIQKMADEFADKGGAGLERIVKKGAQVVLEQAKLNAPTGPTGNLKKDLKIKMKRKGARSKARIGVHRGDQAYYATFVEYGHGGPHRADPHPFLAPAFDAKQNEAFGVIRDELQTKLSTIL